MNTADANMIVNDLDIKNIQICIVGLGYVGLPLAVEFGEKYITLGFDKSKERVNELNQAYDRTLEISSSRLKKLKYLEITSDIEKITSCNIYIITVPTPVDKSNIPDLSPLKSASKMIGQILKKGDIVIYESTVFPGATEEVCVPILIDNSKLEYNLDFFCGYSPERINPGDKERTLKKIIKVVSGSTDNVTDLIDNLYKSIVTAGTYRAPSIKVAEAAKVIENTQRDVNIALINELSMIFNKLDIDTKDILDAAKTKWNFLPFSPGLVGGHCIGVDPYYLTYKAKQIGYNPEMILAGRRINDNMGKYIVDMTLSKMFDIGLKPNESKVAIFGLSFKENCPDLRNTKVFSIIDNLKKHNCEILVTDVYSDNKLIGKEYGINMKNIEKLKDIDVAILAVSHDEYKNIKLEQWKRILNSNSIFIDVKSAYNKSFFKGSNIKYWRL